MLDIEGWGWDWGGNPKILNILNFGEYYNATVSHIQFGMHSIEHPIDVGKPMEYIILKEIVHHIGQVATFVNNWGFEVKYMDGTNDAAV